MTKTKGAAKRGEAALRDFALTYPEAHEEFPWREHVIKVQKKVFVFFGHPEDDELLVVVKLPKSHEVAVLLYAFASPTGYNLGKSGWVTAQFAPDDDPPIEILREWIDESYRAVAPKGRLANVAAPMSDPKGVPARTAVAQVRKRGQGKFVDEITPNKSRGVN